MAIRQPGELKTLHCVMRYPPVLELDGLGHGDAILSNLGGAIRLLNHHVAALQRWTGGKGVTECMREPSAFLGAPYACSIATLWPCGFVGGLKDGKVDGWVCGIGWRCWRGHVHWPPAAAVPAVQALGRKPLRCRLHHVAVSRIAAAPLTSAARLSTTIHCPPPHRTAPHSCAQRAIRARHRAPWARG